MNVSLTPELERLVQEKVKSGRYASVSEVIREGLRLLEEQDELRLQRLADVGRKIDRGLEQLDRGMGIPGKEARERLARASQIKDERVPDLARSTAGNAGNFGFHSCR
jgi:antitoxin ParD1/3/4